ncbi:MAG: hypothetical protein KJ023_00300 [Burkholderiaceae bacterium]|nr:hypothetical protein [Burkholderiaceae bacterium]
MDKSKEGSGSKWAWLPAFMPGVARLMAEKRRELGAEHVARCWEQGVVQQEPGWFYAREGAIAVGVPPLDDKGVARDEVPRYTRGQVLLWLRQAEGAGHGAR